MSSTVSFEITQGQSRGEKFSFSENLPWVFIGRNPDCAIVCRDKTVSRYHCVMNLRPPEVELQDFGSLNGTYLNGTLIGRRENGQSAAEGQSAEYPVYTLHEGSVLTLGKHCSLTVHIQTVESCLDCGEELVFSGDERPPYTDEEGRALCVSCYEKREARKKPCIGCGKLFLPKGEEELQCPSCLAERSRILREALEGLQLPLVQPPKETAGRPSLLEGYEQLGQLGKGAMGEVVRLRRRSDGREFALKTIRSRRAPNETVRRSFLREADISRYLHHENIVESFDVGFCENTPYILMELCEGGNALERMETSGGRLRPELATYIMLQTLTGLDYLHNVKLKVHIDDKSGGYELDCTGVVHRDLKPANIFLSDRGDKPKVKIADFGFSKAMDAAGLSNMSRDKNDWKGSCAWMSREQALNCKYARAEVDVWSAAASYFHMLTAETPRDFSGDLHPLSVVVSREVRSIRQYAPPIPSALMELIDFALQETPQTGFSTAAELRRELIRVLPENISDYCSDLIFV